MNIKFGFAVVLLAGTTVFPAVALADEQVSAQPAVQSEVWLQMQRAGTLASSNIQPATEIERDRAVERFLKTYDIEIPPSFYGSRFGTKN